jgi:plasmid stability protein
MASIIIRNIDESLKTRLRVQAARHGRSMEDEARNILRSSMNGNSAQRINLAAAIRARFAALGELQLPEFVRQPMREPPEFD